MGELPTAFEHKWHVLGCGVLARCFFGVSPLCFGPVVNPPPNLRLEYLTEPDVSPELDSELRDLLSACFNQPHNAFFRERRYANEMPKQRWMLRNADNRLVAHTGAHEKTIAVGGDELRIGGIAEVCVRSEYRGQGIVRYLVKLAHDYFRSQHIEFSMLFGDVEVYGSSGYRRLIVPIRSFDQLTQSFHTAPNEWAMYCSLGGKPWPSGEVDLRGPVF